MKCNIPLQQKLYYPLKHTIHKEIDASINNFLNGNPLVLKNENELQISAKKIDMLILNHSPFQSAHSNLKKGTPLVPKRR